MATRTGISDFSPVPWWLKLWLIGGTAGSILLGIAATWAPMRLGCRAFRQLEF